MFKANEIRSERGQSGFYLVSLVIEIKWETKGGTKDGTKFTCKKI